MTSRLAWILAVVMCLLSGLTSAQHTFVAVPPLTAPVTDLGAALSPEQRSALDDELRAFEARKGSQVAVLIVPTTKPEAIEQYAIRVAEQWKLGRKKVDDGAILVVATDDRTVRIEVGYGLEGVLNDATAKRIIDDVIVPRFSQGDLGGGILAGVESIMKVIDGEPLPAADGPRPAAGGWGLGQILPIVLGGVVVLGGVLRALLGRVAGAAVAGVVVGVVASLLAGAALVGLVAGAFAFVFTLAGGARLAGLYMAQGRGRGGGRWGGRGGGFGGGGASGKW